MELLNEIYKISKKKQETIETVLSKVYDDDLSHDLNTQMSKYRDIKDRAGMQLKKCGYKTESRPFEKAGIWSRVQAETIFNTSTEHIADMMVQSSARSMVDIMENIRDNYDTKGIGIEMAKELADFEEDNIRILKSYL